MNKFKKPYKAGPRGGGRFGDRGPGRPSGPREKSFQKFDAVCSKCGNACQVPFRPNGTRPVYCSNCFGAPHQTSGDRVNFSPREISRRSPEPRTGTKTIADLERQVGAMNTKIDTILRILEEVSADVDDDEEEEEGDIEVLEATKAPQKKAQRGRPRSS